MKRHLKIFLLLSIFMVSLSPLCFADKGCVVFADDNKSIMVIQTEPDYLEQYTCVEVHSFIYPYPEVGDYVYGTLANFASQTLYHPRTDKSFTVWIDQYWMSKDDAIKWIRNYN